MTELGRGPVASSAGRSRPASGTATSWLIGAVFASAVSPFGWATEPFTLRIFDILLMVVLGIAILRSLAGAVIRVPSDHLTLACLVALLGYQVVNAAVLTSAGNTLLVVGQAAEMVLAAVVVAAVTRRPEQRTAFLDGLTTGVLVIAVATALHHMSSGSLDSFKDLGATRQSFGLLAVLLLSRRSARGLLGSRSLLLLAVALLALSGERKAWLAVLAAAGAVWTLRWFRERSRAVVVRRTNLAALVLLAVFGVGPLLAQAVPDDSYTGRQLRSITELPALLSADESTGQSASNESRRYALDNATALFASHTMFGVGPNQFRELIREDAVNRGMPVNNPHNEYMKVAVETGVVGLALYLLLLLRLGVLALRALRHHTPPEAQAIVALLVYAVTVNLFLAGGVLNTLFVIIPLGLLMGSRPGRATSARAPAPSTHPSFGARTPPHIEPPHRGPRRR